jgi:hypothetical protein
LKRKKKDTLFFTLKKDTLFSSLFFLEDWKMEDVQKFVELLDSKLSGKNITESNQREKCIFDYFLDFAKSMSKLKVIKPLSVVWNDSRWDCNWRAKKLKIIDQSKMDWAAVIDSNMEHEDDGEEEEMDEVAVLINKLLLSIVVRKKRTADGLYKYVTCKRKILGKQEFK